YVISCALSLAVLIACLFIEYMHLLFLFLVVLPLVVIDVIFAFFILKDVITRTFPKVDFPSIILSTLGFGGLLFGFSTLGGENNRAITFAVIFIGLIALTLFIQRQFRLTQPILEFRVFKNRTFRITTFIGMI